jgi:hypothetical protein
MTLLSTYYNPDLVQQDCYSLAETPVEGYMAPEHSNLKVGNQPCTSAWQMPQLSSYVQEAYSIIKQADIIGLPQGCIGSFKLCCSSCWTAPE